MEDGTTTTSSDPAMETEAMESGPTEEDWGEDISPDKDGMVFKKILREGEGDERPGKKNQVYVHYTGCLLDGTVFDSSVARNELFDFKLGQQAVIKGWDVGVATMRKGEKCLLTCRPEYAYGKKGSGDKIPPDSTLQFEVELFDWKGEDVTNDGGVIMYVLEEGSGWKTPNDGSSVKVHLQGTYENNVFEDRDIEFDIGEGTEHSVIEGVERGLEKMKENEKAKFIIKPKYAFGAAGDSSKGIPPNAEVTYIVTLKSFVKPKSSYEYDDVDERINDSTALKEKGTTYFKSTKYSLALKIYKRGLDIVNKSSVYKEEEKQSTRQIRILLQLNMAACYLKLDSAVEAKDCCVNVLEEDSNNVKAHFRKGQAYQLMQDYEEAIKCFQEVLKLETANRPTQVHIQECRKKIKQQLEKDKKLYSNMFRTIPTSNKKSDENESVKKDSPVKDAIAQAVDEENVKMED